jgi:hypothetical protein
MPITKPATRATFSGIVPRHGRLFRVVVADVPYHVTQRGNARQFLLASVRGFLAAGETESERAALRRCTRTGRPLGSEEFLQALEAKTHRRLAPQKGGRPRKQVADKRQAVPALTP